MAKRLRAALALKWDQEFESLSSSGDSCTNLTSLSRASLMAAVASPPMCKVETNAEPLRSHWGQSRAAL